MKKFQRLIFVDENDTTLGPMAEAIMRKKYLLEPMEICSRGLVGTVSGTGESEGGGGAGQQRADGEGAYGRAAGPGGYR